VITAYANANESNQLLVATDFPGYANDILQTIKRAVDSAAAEGIDFLGRIYIRRRQHQLLIHYVTSAQPLVYATTKDVQEALEPIQASLNDPNQSLPQKLSNAFLNSATTHGKVDFATAQSMAGLLNNVRECTALTDSGLASLQKYRDAHSAMVAAIKDEGSLPGTIAQITALQDEINAARKIKGKFK
jgi:hypothetical protein